MKKIPKPEALIHGIHGKIRSTPEVLYVQVAGTVLGLSKRDREIPQPEAVGFEVVDREAWPTSETPLDGASRDAGGRNRRGSVENGPMPAADGDSDVESEWAPLGPWGFRRPCREATPGPLRSSASTTTGLPRVFGDFGVRNDSVTPVRSTRKTPA